MHIPHKYRHLPLYCTFNSPTLPDEPTAPRTFRMPTALPTHLMLVGVALLYGVNYNVMKLVTPAFVPPFPLILLRISGAVVLFGTLYALFIRERVARRDYGRLLEGGVLGVTGSQLCYAQGLAFTSALNASVIMTLIPVFVLLSSIFLLGVRISASKWLGIALGGTGAFLLVGGTAVTFSAESIAGDLLILANAAFFGVYLVRMKPLMARYHPLTISTWTFLAGWCVVLPFSWVQASALSFSFPTHIVWALAFIVIGATFFVYLLNVSALRRASPGLVGFYVYFQPLVATSISLFYQTDTLTFSRVFAACLVFLGVYWVNKR